MRQLSAFDVPILSARVGDNAGLIADALLLHLEDGERVLDPTYGRGNFWSAIEPGRFDLIASDFADGGPDARELPFEDGEFDAIILDPPYIPTHDGDLKASIDATYRVNSSGLRSASDVIRFYADALAEAQRVLRLRGLAFVKCQDTTENHRAYWVHTEVQDAAERLGMVAIDLFVLVQRGAPAQRHRSQERARRNHSYLWVFKKERA
jgi:DNA modification methylase